MIFRTTQRAVLVVATLAALSACGGTGAGAAGMAAIASAPSSSPASAEIQGIATPSSVAVVTATNAN